MKFFTKNIQYLVLLWLFIHPTAIQFLHHHNDEGVNHEYSGSTLHEQHIKCAVCNFHFPIFSNFHPSIQLQNRDILFEKLVIHCVEPPVTPILHIGYLRGPPAGC